MISYSEATLVTQSPIFIVFVILSWLLPLLIFTLIAVINTKKTSGGSYKIRPLISSGALAWVFVVWGVLGLLLSALLIFPVFLRLSFLSYFF